MRSSAALLLLLSVPSLARAQPDQDLPPGHPPLGDMPPGMGMPPEPGDDGEPRGGDPHAGLGRTNVGMGGREALDAAEPDPELPRGTVVVRIVDPEARTVSAVRVQLRELAAGGSPRVRTAQTDASGEVMFSGLPVGAGHAYRAVVANGPARYPSAPFQLEEQAGTRVTITRWPITESTRSLIISVLRTFIELGPEGDRLRVTQHLQLMNLGAEAIAAPDGIAWPAPRGLTAFRAEEGMGEQEVVERGGELRIVGVLRPGTAQLAYSFDLPLDGRKYWYEQRLPFRIVLAEAYVEKTPDLTLTVPGMGRPEAIDLDGREFLMARLMRRPRSPNLSKLKIELANLPGPGPGRWLALGLAVLAVGLGLASRFVGRDRRSGERAALVVEKERLIADIVRLDEQHGAGQIDEGSHRSARAQDLARLAEVLRLEARG